MSEEQDQPVGKDRAQPDDSEPIPERQAELRAKYKENTALAKPPYFGIKIRTRGELTWILHERGWSGECDPASPDVQVKYAVDVLGGKLRGSETEDQLREKLMVSAREHLWPGETNAGGLPAPNFEGTDFRGANLAGVHLYRARLVGALLDQACLRGADLSRADLRGAHLWGTDLTGATLWVAKLNNAHLLGASLLEADLSRADLQGARLQAADLRGADLQRTLMSASTILMLPHLDERTMLGDAGWNGAVVSLVDWSKMRRLGDEQRTHRNKTARQRVRAYRATARAYHGVALVLHSQGLLIQAAQYRLREHKFEQKALLWEGKLFSWLGSALLGAISGYGDRPGRALVCYITVVSTFAAIYYTLTNGYIVFIASHSSRLRWYEALVLSVSSFHGRGFFPTMLSLGDPLAIAAAAEAIIGLFIELVFIATFTRRYLDK